MRRSNNKLNNFWNKKKLRNKMKVKKVKIEKMIMEWEKLKKTK